MATVRVGYVGFDSAATQAVASFSAAASLTASGTTGAAGGIQFTVIKGFIGVRYSLDNPKNYKGGDTVTITAAEYAALPPSLTRTISGSAVSGPTPTYPAYPFRHFPNRP